MNLPIACTYQDAELNHLRDALEMDVAQRWAWLQEAMDYGFAMAQQRAARGLVTLGPHGEVLWPLAAGLDTATSGPPSP